MTYHNHVDITLTHHSDGSIQATVKNAGRTHALNIDSTAEAYTVDATPRSEAGKHLISIFGKPLESLFSVLTELAPIAEELGDMTLKIYLNTGAETDGVDTVLIERAESKAHLVYEGLYPSPKSYKHTSHKIGIAGASDHITATANSCGGMVVSGFLEDSVDMEHLPDFLALLKAARVSSKHMVDILGGMNAARDAVEGPQTYMTLF